MIAAGSRRAAQWCACRTSRPTGTSNEMRIVDA
jgi:hypothetical protein